MQEVRQMENLYERDSPSLSWQACGTEQEMSGEMLVQGVCEAA